MIGLAPPRSVCGWSTLDERAASDGPPAPVEGTVTLATRPVARLPLRLTELSLGCAQLGNLYRAITDEQARATVDTAWEEGIRYFDTAPHYGLGLSERRLGWALAGRPRSEYVVSTKVGRRLEPLSRAGQRDDEGFDVAATHRRVWDFSRDGVLASMEESLERLGLDTVDIVYLHDPDEYRREALDTAYPALEESRAQGVVSAIGAGMNQTAMLADFARHTDMDVLMLVGPLHAARATGARRPVARLRTPRHQDRRRRRVQQWATRTPCTADGAKYNYDDAPEALVLLARRMAEICERYGTSLPVTIHSGKAEHLLNYWRNTDWMPHIL